MLSNFPFQFYQDKTELAFQKWVVTKPLTGCMYYIDHPEEISKRNSTNSKHTNSKRNNSKRNLAVDIMQSKSTYRWKSYTAFYKKLEPYLVEYYTHKQFKTLADLFPGWMYNQKPIHISHKNNFIVLPFILPWFYNKRLYQPNQEMIEWIRNMDFFIDNPNMKFWKHNVAGHLNSDHKLEMITRPVNDWYFDEDERYYKIRSYQIYTIAPSVFENRSPKLSWRREPGYDIHDIGFELSAAKVPYITRNFTLVELDTSIFKCHYNLNKIKLSQYDSEMLHEFFSGKHIKDRSYVFKDNNYYSILDLKVALKWISSHK